MELEFLPWESMLTLGVIRDFPVLMHAPVVNSRANQVCYTRYGGHYYRIILDNPETHPVKSLLQVHRLSFLQGEPYDWQLCYDHTYLPRTEIPGRLAVILAKESL